MERHTFPDQNGLVKRHLLHWAANQPYCVWLDSCNTDMDRYGNYDFVMGVATKPDPALYYDLADLEDAILHEPMAWRFGFLSYELKEDIEPRLKSVQSPLVPFPKMGMFKADVVATKERGADKIVFECGWSPELLKAIFPSRGGKPGISGFSGFTSNFTKEAYCAMVELLRQHIRDGDVYEVNLSQCFSAHVKINSPVSLWERLKESSPVPFAGYCKWEDLYLLCASPERFLRLHRHKLMTQPIKGTVARGTTPEADAQYAFALRNSTKEQAENVMIVDLSRNDLFRSCEVGSVEVPYLFEVQTFPQVHHLVSTVVGRKRRDVHAVQTLRNTFPPGSMTGAPKVRACELIAEYEPSTRGLYSGALGYIGPNDDFDFNVVIRSLAYDAQAQVMTYHVGGAITWDSEPQAEYEETLLKAKAIEGLFS